MRIRDEQQDVKDYQRRSTTGLLPTISLSVKLDNIYLPQATATPYTRGTREQIRSSSLIHFGALSFWFLFLYIK